MFTNLHFLLMLFLSLFSLNNLAVSYCSVNVLKIGRWGFLLWPTQKLRLSEQFSLVTCLQKRAITCMCAYMRSAFSFIDDDEIGIAEGKECAAKY